MGKAANWGGEKKRYLGILHMRTWWFKERKDEIRCSDWRHRGGGPLSNRANRNRYRAPITGGDNVQTKKGVPFTTRLKNGTTKCREKECAPPPPGYCLKMTKNARKARGKRRKGIDHRRPTTLRFKTELGGMEDWKKYLRRRWPRWALGETKKGVYTAKWPKGGNLELWWTGRKKSRGGKTMSFAHIGVVILSAKK